MHAAPNRHPYLLTGLLGLAAVLLSVLGVACLVGWIPDAVGTTAAAPPAAAPGAARPRQPTPWSPASRGKDMTSRCADCGVIESVRILVGAADTLSVDGAAAGTAGAVPPRYETTVRFDDGSTRIFASPNPAPWHRGERIKVVGDAIRAHG